MSKGWGAQGEDCGRTFRASSSSPPPNLPPLSSYPAKWVFRVVWPKGIFPFLLLAFLAFGCAKNEPRLLRYSFSTEGTQRYRTTLTMSSPTGSLTQILIEETHRFQGLLPSGTASMEVHFDTVEVHLTNPQNLAPSILARNLQGKTVRLAVSSRGEI